MVILKCIESFNICRHFFGTECNSKDKENKVRLFISAHPYHSLVVEETTIQWLQHPVGLP